jgi:hypothetical protein
LSAETVAKMLVKLESLCQTKTMLPTYVGFY